MSIITTTTSAAIALQGAAGQSTAVAAAGAGLKIYVVGYMLTADAAGTVKFESNTTALTGVMAVATNGQLSDTAPNGGYLFATAANEALKFTSATSKCAGYVIYYIGA